MAVAGLLPVAGLVAFAAIMAVGYALHGTLFDEALSNAKEGFEDWHIEQTLKYFFQYYCAFISKGEAPRGGVLVFRKGTWDDITDDAQISEFHYTDQPRMNLYGGDHVVIYGYEGKGKFNVQIYIVDPDGKIYNDPIEAGTYDINMSGIAIESKSDYERRYRSSAKSHKYIMGWSEISK